MSALDEIWDLVRAIPAGKCISYGELGRALHNPATGRMVGRWMAQCPEGLPWWRVIAKTGGFPIEKRDPTLGITQRQLLEQEKVPFLEDGRVDLEACGWAP